MASITVWALESDYDAAVCKVLANKLVAQLQLSKISIRSVGKGAIPRRTKGNNPSDILKRAVTNYLKQDDCLIFVIDKDGVMSSNKRRQEPNSLVNQIERVLKEKSFSGRVHLAFAVQELEAWLLVDCLGILCYFASKRKTYKNECRKKVKEQSNLTKLLSRYQRGDTTLIVEAEMGGKGVKEYLVEFSKEILKTVVNPKNWTDNKVQ